VTFRKSEKDNQIGISNTNPSPSIITQPVETSLTVIMGVIATNRIEALKTTDNESQDYGNV